MIRTSQFLAAFRRPDEPLHLRSFKPRNAVETPDNLPEKWTTTLADITGNRVLQQQLIKKNKHCGIYFVVNPGGDTDAEITRYAASFVENDTLPIAEQHKRLDACPIQPSIRVETRKSVHAYWLIDGECSESEWRDIQSRLIAFFDGDPKIKNPSRVMRLPNFDHLHLNGHGLEKKKIAVHTFAPERRFKVQGMVEAFPAPKDVSHGQQRPVNGTFEYNEDRHAELCQRIMARGRRNSRGNWDAPALCHGGKGSTGLVYFPATDAVTGNAEPKCNYFAILRAEGLPDDHLPSRNRQRVTSETKKENEPEPIPWPQLEPMAFYGLSGDIVRTIEPHSEADPVALLIQTIVAFGNCVGRAPYFQVEGDRHHLNLTTVIVGTSSKSRKRTSLGQAIRPFKAVDEGWATDCIQSGLSTGEGLIWAVRDPIEKKEPIKEKGRVTGYQTVIVDHGVDDKRLLIQEAEFAKVLRVMAREGNTLSAVMRQAARNRALSPDHD